MSLRKIVTGTALVSSANLVRILAQFIALPLLSRLLTSTDYGLVGIASPFIVFAMAITDAGIGMSLVRSVPLEDEVTWSTSFWLILALGTGFAAILAALAPLATYVFGEPRLELIWIILALTIGAQAAAIIPGAALQQAQRFSTIARLEISSILLSIAAAVIAGLLGAGVWALVAQQTVFFIARFTLTFVYSPFRPRLIFNLPKLKSHLAFGRDVVGVNMVAQFAGSIDNLVIGHVLGPAAVGLYAMAMQFVRLPTIVVSGPLQFVLYSHMSVIKDDLAAIRRVFLLVTRILGIIVFPTLGMAAAAHFSAFNILLSEKWSQSGTIFMILSAAGAVQAMTALGGDIMLILGRSDLRLRTTVEFGLIWLGALALSVFHDIYWVAVACNCAVLLYLPRILSLVLSLLQCSLRAYLKAMIMPALATLASIMLYTEIVGAFVLQKYADVGLAALLAVGTMVICALAQLSSLVDESALLALPFRSRNPAAR